MMEICKLEGSNFLKSSIGNLQKKKIEENIQVTANGKGIFVVMNVSHVCIYTQRNIIHIYKIR